MAKRTMSFLGANTPKGFVSFFDELYNPYKTTDAYIIKGGPGTGKSTLMKKIAAEAEKKGFATERIFCSSDPDSLDAVIIPEKGFSICDGTSPHTVEPRFPGAAENIINPGAFWDEKKLKSRADEIRKLFFEASLYHRTSSKYLAAAGHIDEQSRRCAASYVRSEKIDSYAARFIRRETPDKHSGQPGEKKKRFLSAISPSGNIFFSQTVRELCPRVIGIDDRTGVVAPLLVSQIGEGAVKNGYGVIYCHCPMKSDECEHLLIPEKGIALIRLHAACAEIECDRVIHSGRFIREEMSENRTFFRFNEKIKAELILESVRCLKKAKETHGLLEEIYRDAMDFEALDRYTEEFIGRVFE